MGRSWKIASDVPIEAIHTKTERIIVFWQTPAQSNLLNNGNVDEIDAKYVKANGKKIFFIWIFAKKYLSVYKGHMHWEWQVFSSRFQEARIWW